MNNNVKQEIYCSKLNRLCVFSFLFFRLKPLTLLLLLLFNVIILFLKEN